MPHRRQAQINCRKTPSRRTPKTQPTPDPTFSVVINRTINAPRERVFEAWTNPAHLHRWWAVQEDFTVPIAEVDLRIGGSYRLGMQVPDQEQPFIVTGVYREISPPEKLVFTWKWEAAPPPYAADWVPTETLVTIEFFDRDGSTEVRLTHEMFPDETMRDEHDQGWGRCLNSLTRYLPIGLSSDASGRIL